MLNSIALVFEKIVLQYLTNLTQGKISKHQHGFIKGKSTSTNLMEFIEYVSTSLERGREAHAIYTDFSKAFDTVDHLILLEKLSSLGVNGKLLSWFNSYLANRSLMVSFNGSLSKKFSPGSGVPQGSILGPILFSIFINDLTSKLKCNFFLFADDLKIFTEISDPYDMILLQRDIDALYEWCSISKLHLNVDKCNFIAFSNRIVPLVATYHINNSPLAKVTQIKNLGIIVDAHIENLRKKSFKMLGFVMRATNQFTNYSCVYMLYNSLVRSNLDYVSSVWNPFRIGQIAQLERVQRNYTKQLAFKFQVAYNSYEDRLNHFKILKLEHRRTSADMSQLHKIFHEQGSTLFNKLSFRDNPYPNRSNNLFTVPKSRSNYGKFLNPINRFQSTFNSQFNHIEIENLNLDQFKKQILTALINQMP